MKCGNTACSKEDLLLYAVTDRSWLNGQTLYEQVESALKGGVTFVQLREKDLDEETFLAEAEELQKLCAEYHVPFVINDKGNVILRAQLLELFCLCQKRFLIQIFFSELDKCDAAF